MELVSAGTYRTQRPALLVDGICSSRRIHQQHQHEQHCWRRRRPHSLRVVSKQAAPSPPAVSGQSSSRKLFECVVVGGGISGLCIAQALVTKQGAAQSSIVVAEAKDRVGGNITTVHSDGYLWEEGPNSFQPNDSMLTMAVDSGLKEELVLGDPEAPRFVLWGGRLRKVPAGLGDLPFFDLLSIGGKIRAGLGALGLRPAPPGQEESVEEFVRRNLGDEVFERLIEPFCSGVYAGDPSRLSMKAAFGRVWRLEGLGGSIIGGTIKLAQEKKKNPAPPRDPRLPRPKGQTVGSFREGLIALPNAIAGKLGDSVRLNWKLLSVRKALDIFRLVFATPNGTREVWSKSVVLTIPSYIASEILRPVSTSVGEHLSEIYYPPVAAVTLSYPKSAIREERLVAGELRGFGQLHPRSQGVETLGTIYSSALFPGRAPEGRVLLLSYIGGATNTQIAMKDDDAIVQTVDRDLRKMLLRPDACSPTVHKVRLWTRAIPQFTVGHLDRVESAQQALRESGLDGLFLAGNYVSGVALGRCVEGAYETAEKVSMFLKQQQQESSK